MGDSIYALKFGAGQKTTSAMARWHWLDGRPCTYNLERHVSDLLGILLFGIFQLPYTILFSTHTYCRRTQPKYLVFMQITRISTSCRKKFEFQNVISNDFQQKWCTIFCYMLKKLWWQKLVLIFWGLTFSLIYVVYMEFGGKNNLFSAAM